MSIDTLYEEELPSRSEVTLPIEGKPEGKNLLSIGQFNVSDIDMYLEEAEAAERLRNSDRRGMPLLEYYMLKAVMRQPSTRTGGSAVTAFQSLGGTAERISGSEASSESKGESLTDSWVAYATQAHILGIRTAENDGPTIAAQAIQKAINDGKLPKPVPVINFGDGTNEHPTQALGDLYTIKMFLGQLQGVKIALVGDQERYRAFHSLELAAYILGMTVIAVESRASKVPEGLVEKMGNSLIRTDNLDDAMKEADVLYPGRRPDEYEGRGNRQERKRSRQLSRDYDSWVIDKRRIQQMRKDSIIMHARPRRYELHPSVDSDPRTVDIRQMYNMNPMRMAIFALHLGKSIAHARPPLGSSRIV